MEKPQWRASVLAIATVVLMGVSASDANALALGRITVQSALGEPLRAEIEIPEINAEELASLRTAVASPDAFRAAGLDYSPALSNLKITLQRRPDGRHFLHLASDRPVTEPFLDLILETNWSSGRIVRDYTMLFDPPNLRPAAPPVAAQVSPVAPATRLSPSARPPAGRSPAAAATRPSSSGDGKQVTVQGGDTAGRIAAANKPSSVSLDQMLVAMLRANPEAFIGGNVNRLRSGAVLEMPTAEQAGAVSSGEASQTVIAQSRDFNEFRRRLAEGLPATRIGAADRQASGKVQAQVEEKKPGAAAPDKLTLSKGGVQDKGQADKIARDRTAKDAAMRVAELNKNIADLNKLGSATAAPVPSGSASAAKPAVAVPSGAATAAPAGPAAMAATASATKAAVLPSLPAPPVVTAPPVVAAPAVVSVPPPPAAVSAASAASATSASAPVVASPAETAAATTIAAPASAPADAASGASAVPVSTAAAQTTDGAAQPAAPAAAASTAKRVIAAPAPVEPSLLDDMLENPIVPATLGGVLALLLGFGFYRAQQRKKSTQVDSSFLESRLQPDSFFGASGGQRIDTNESAATGSSMVYSPSQLDAAGDVDPVAEADVYLAYGRDLQAEEILKEAMRTTPQRVAIHSKLLEIYSKRRDAKAFALVATEAYGLTRGHGPEWEHICELGRELDPASAMFRPGGQPPAGATTSAAVATATATPDSFGTTVTQAQPLAPAADLDLDLDFSIGDDEPAPAAPVLRRAKPEEPTSIMEPLPDPIPSLDMDFGTTDVAVKPVAPAAAGRPEPARPETGRATANDPKPVAAPAAAAPASDAGMIEFDLGTLSFNPDSPASPSQQPAPVASQAKTDIEAVDTGAPSLSTGFEDTGGDPLATKLALAQEFNAIGDPDGARSLAQEVLAEASGDLKRQAQRFLAEIS